MTQPSRSLAGKQRGAAQAPILGLIGAVLAAVIGAAALIYVSSRHETVTVPSVRGEALGRAKDKLDDSGLGVYVSGRRFSGRPEGKIISQNPAGGSTVDTGSHVGLMVSKGSPPPTCVHAPIHTSSIAGEARLATLRSGDEVEAVENPVQGTYRGLPPSTDVWLIVYSDRADRLYPQTHHTDQPSELLADGRFRSAASFGGTSGENYEVIVVLANQQASRFLSARLREWAQVGEYDGLVPAQLPAGLDEEQCVSVTLRP